MAEFAFVNKIVVGEMCSYFECLVSKDFGAVVARELLAVAVDATYKMVEAALSAALVHDTLDSPPPQQAPAAVCLGCTASLVDSASSYKLQCKISNLDT